MTTLLLRSFPPTRPEIVPLVSGPPVPAKGTSVKVISEAERQPLRWRRAMSAIGIIQRECRRWMGRTPRLLLLDDAALQADHDGMRAIAGPQLGEDVAY